MDTANSIAPPPGFVDDYAPPDGFVEDTSPPPGFIADDVAPPIQSQGMGDVRAAETQIEPFDYKSLPPWDARRIAAASPDEMLALETEAQQRPMVTMPKPGDPTFQPAANATADLLEMSRFPGAGIAAAGMRQIGKLDEDSGAGVAAAQRVAEGFSTPENVMLGAAVPAAVTAGVPAALISGGFAAHMGKNLVDEGLPNVAAAVKEHGITSPEAGAALVDAGTTGLMTAATAAHAAGRPARVAPIENAVLPETPIPATQAIIDATKTNEAKVESVASPLPAAKSEVVEPILRPGETKLEPTTPKASEFVPAIKVGEDIVRGNKGETHQDILNRFMDENPDRAGDALVDFDTKENPNLFLRGEEAVTREQLREQLGVSDSQGLRKLQAKVEETAGPEIAPEGKAAAENPAPPLADQPRNAVGGMGPDERAEMKAGLSVTTLKNAANDERRTELGLPARQPILERAFGPLWDDAMRAFDADEAVGQKLVNDLNQKSRPLTDREDAILTHEQMNRQEEYDRATQDIIKATTPEERTAAEAAQESARAALFDVFEVGNRAGTENARGLNARKLMIAEDYTPVKMEYRAEAAKGSPLTPDERTKIKTQAETIERLQKQTEELSARDAENAEKMEATKTYEETIRRLEEEAGTRPKYSDALLARAEKIVSALEKKAAESDAYIKNALGRTSAGVDPTLAYHVGVKFAAWIARNGLDKVKAFSAMRDLYGEGIEQGNLLDKAWKAGQVLFNKETGNEVVRRVVKAKAEKIKPTGPTPDSVKARAKAEATAGEELSHKTVYDLAEAHIRAGIHGEEAVIKAVHKDVKESYPDATERDVRRAYSEYGKVKFPNKDAVKTELRELRTLTRLQESIDRETEGLASLRTGLQRDKASQAIREKQTRLNELLKKRKGPPSPEQLASRDEARQTALRNRIADIDKELRTGEKPAKGVPAPDSVAVEQLKAERDAMLEKLKEIDDAKNPPPSPAQKALDSALVARERAQQTLDDISTGKTPAAKLTKEALTQLEEDIRLETDALKSLASEMRRDAKPKTDPDYAKEQSAIKSLEDAIRRYSERTAASDFSAAPKTHGPDTRRVAALKEVRDSRKAAYDAARRADRPVERYNKTRLSQIKRDTAAAEKRLAAGDFSPRPKKVQPALAKDTLDALAELETVKNKIRMEENDWRLARRSIERKIWDGVKQTFRASINLVSSFDFSGFRQAFGALLANTGRTLIPLDVTYNAAGKLRPSVTNPIKSAKLMLGPTGRMFSGWLTEKRALRIEQERKVRQNAKSGAYKEMGIDFSDIAEGPKGKHEEALYSVLDEWGKLPLRTGSTAKTVFLAPGKVLAKGVHMSNRAFATLLNETRADLADHLLELNFQDRAPTHAELKVIGNYVNIATGRGNINPAVSNAAGKVFWAPSLFASRVKALAGEPIWGGKQPLKGTGRARGVVAKDYARLIASGYLLWKIGQYFSDKDEEDPTSSDYGKIVRGNTRIDPWGGHQQVIVAAARAKMGKTTSIDGGERKNDLGQIIANFGRNKLRPDWGALWNAYDIYLGSPKPGRPATYGDAGLQLVRPMGLGEVVKVLKDRGFSEGMIVNALGVFGAGVSVYGDEEDTKRSR